MELLILIVILCAAVQETARDTIQAHLDPAAYAARKRRRARVGLWMLGVLLAAIAVPLMAGVR